MKKKLIFILLILLLLVGCSKKEEENANKEEEKVPENTVVLQDIEYTLDQDDEVYGLKIKVAKNFRKTELVNAVNYFSENINDRAYFVIRLFEYKNKDIEYVIKDIAEEYDSRKELKVGDIDYTFIHFINFTKADVNIYIHTHKDTTYAITFTSGIDMSKLEDIFLKNIQYE